MRELSRWSTRRVIWACVLWLVGAPVATAVGLILGGLVLAGLSGNTRVQVSASLNNLVFGWLFLPPILLVAAWIWARRRRNRATPDESGSE
jgi:phosphate/sulfate permease